jgi:uncharacterized protein with beta-barrel porin domain/membrane-associated phospholipid phosphatase
LTLNTTSVGQTTLTQNLSTALSINNSATPTLESLAISDKNILGSTSNSVTGLAGNYGVAGNLAGGLPAQAVDNGITPVQPVGGLGPQLGAIYNTGINAYANGASTALKNTSALLVNAYNFTSADLGVAKYYFANGTTNGTTKAVAPSGYTLPTANGLPNTTNSVYDLAYGVKNTGVNQDIYGDSRPAQVAASSINGFDPSALTGISTNPSFPSGHTNYAFTDSILIGMLVPQEYSGMLERAAQYGNSRIVLGVHYPLDIIASRAFASYDLAQAFTNPQYINTATTTGAAINLPSLFTAASTELNGYLSAQCGGTVTACAAGSANTTNNPFNVSASTLATYASELTYGLPTLTYTQAPRENAPAGGPDASILLATVYGGSSSAATTIAPNGGLLGSLQTSTINQIIYNTEGNALSAFYGTSLSYWSRVNLLAADNYFSGVTGVLTLATTDKVNTPVTIASTGVLVDNGLITGAATVGSGGVLGGVGSVTGATSIQSGGALSPGVFNASGIATGPGTLTINGGLTFAPGSTYAVQIGSTASLVNVSGAATLGGAAVTPSFALGSTVANKYTIVSAGSVSGTFGAVANTGLPTNFTDTLSYDPSHAYLNLGLNFANSGPLNTNQQNVGSAISSSFASAGSIPLSYASLNAAGLSQVDGELATGSHYAAFNAMNGFVEGFFYGGGVGDGGLVGAHAPLSGVSSYDSLPTHKGLQQVTPPPAVPTWTVWSEGYGQSQRIGGNVGVGSNALSDQTYGAMVGADYRLGPDTVVGFGFGGAGENFSVANLNGSGSASIGQIGAYGAHSFGGIYVAGAFAYGIESVGDTRTVTAGAGNSLQSNFDVNTIEGRAEIGDRFDFAWASVTPFGAVSDTELWLPSYSETSLSGSTLFALNYAAQSVNDAKTQFGFYADKSFALTNSVLTLFGKAAWGHDFNPQQSATASFQSLPGSSFTVYGAAPDKDSAITRAGAEIHWGHGFAASAAFEGEFSGNVHSYGGRGAISYSW